KRWIELFSDYECEIRYHPCKKKVVADALSKRDPEESFKEKNLTSKILCGLDQLMERKEDRELVQETTDKVVLINENLKAARDRQKSYVDNRRKLLEFKVEDQVLLKVSPWKGVVRLERKTC
nr:reverse transcriptase domain-containing protein [Tanacetum cinerariifolium]